MNEMYAPLSPVYSELFRAGISHFGNQINERRRYALFYPSFGTPEQRTCDFLFLGQAVKGWKPEFETASVFDEQYLIDGAARYSNTAYKTQDAQHSPLDWVNVYWSKGTYNKHIDSEQLRYFYPQLNYQVFKSFFWNVVYKLICKHYNLNMNGWDWSRKLVWSNLYKITPAERENPSEEERMQQNEYATRLIQCELNEIKPKFCIVLTNDSWWEPFRKKLSTGQVALEKSGMSFIESIELYKETIIVITKRPFIGNSSACVAEISAIIS